MILMGPIQPSIFHDSKSCALLCFSFSIFLSFSEFPILSAIAFYDAEMSKQGDLHAVRH